MNGDVGQRAAVDVSQLPWVELARGNEERLFERLLTPRGSRESRMLRLAPGAQLRYPSHSGALDIFVLEGALMVDGATHREGTFLGLSAADRPDATAPTGALAVAKLRPSQRAQRRVVSTQGGAWQPSHTAGFWVMDLDRHEDGRVVLLRFDPGTHLARHHHVAGEEFFVIDGALRDEDGTYRRHWWVRQPHGSVHSIVSERGCIMLTTAGHLAPASEVV